MSTEINEPPPLSIDPGWFRQKPLSDFGDVGPVGGKKGGWGQRGLKSPRSPRTLK
jgi:hypothetical protein